MSEVKRKVKTKKSKFWRGFVIYVGVLAVLVAVLLIYVWNTMKKYEASQPEPVAVKVAEQLSAGDTSMVSEEVSNKFETASVSADLFADSVKGKDLTVSVKSTKATEMQYNLLDNDKVVATVTLKAENQHNIMGILSIADWKVSEVKAVTQAGNNNVSVTVPETYKVYINDVQLGNDEMTGDASVMEGMEYVAEYVELPKFVTYKVKGLINTPVLTVYDADDNPVDLSEVSDYSDVKIGYSSTEMPQELYDHVWLASKSYSNFFSRDLEGCGVSTACLQPFFPANSYYIDLAEQYRQGDMWMYSSHNTPEFNNVSITEYTVYSEVCFSCRVIFDKSMYLTATGETKTEHNDQTYYYVNLDGNWLIADIKTNSAE
ncbi:MAG: hypothetical protein ACI4EW_07985 [Butyrivibrio sp.]